MPAARRLRPVRAALAVALGLALVACTGGDPAPGPGTPTPTVDPGPQPDDVVATAVIPEGGVDLELRVHPLVRAGEHVVLTLDVVPLEELDEDVRIGGFDVTSFVAEGKAPVNVRLFDLAADVVHHVGADADGEPVVAPERWHRIRAAHGTRLQMPFAAPADDVAALSLLVPGAPLFAEVPIIEGEVPPAAHPDDVAAAADAAATAAALASASPSATPDVEEVEPPEELDLDAVVSAPTFPLESTSAELHGAVRTIESTERVEVTLGSDVLFAFDSADLTPESAQAVALVAQRLAEREKGTVEVVGHTDDQADDAYNRDLSRRRAQAVADALAAQAGGAGHRMRVDGRGESEPVADNTSDEGRALNRRVTVSLTSKVVTRTDVTTEGELPAFGAHVGAAGTPLRVETVARTWEVDATARRVHGHVVVDLTVHAADDKDGLGWAVGFLRGFSSHRPGGTVTPHGITARGTVLQGASRLFPLDYRVGENELWPDGEWFTASDLDASSWIDGGQTRTFSFVYPRLDVDTVVFQAGTGVAFDTDFRLVDIPVAPEVAAPRAPGASTSSAPPDDATP
ncbi:OmpA family protein [Cellulomonas xiejunii]|uniref:OmpA family protein n=1 Tax=Cellulomonas xiejunii TaxID=2968083 RepID=A0ABY5KQG4_9CELL|nr:OmpA family protein [Cellulomonas xiejunii]MCC2321456.1 OmpA family protein [Cellulomonas xiejunii]MCC2323392.1 OmpA family protein [Cellulomonas xiejunii]UUI72030.1 OmpA family protein [Cellulomonas xiejunii]